MRTPTIPLYALALASAISLQASGADERYILHHRFSPSSTSASSSKTEFEPYASLSLGGSPASGEASDVSLDQLDSGVKEAVSGDDNGRGWYQVGLQLDIDDDEDQWLISSIPSCYLASPPIGLTVLSNGYQQPSSISLSPNPSSSGVSCHKSNDSITTIALPSTDSFNVDVQRFNKVKSPVLSPSLQIDGNTGLPATPPPEKSFLMKYWMYILAAGLFFAIIMGPEEPQSAAGKTK